MNWYMEVLKKYATFQGRARRKEYWYFALFNILITIVLSIIDAAGGLMSAEAGIGLLSGLYWLAILIPTIAVSVRRLHDINRTGWWLFLSLVPIVGPIVLLVFAVQDGTQGENKYGPNPKTATA
jgi:uncharacterized membrane protein YhaH (DUF805 family)